MRRVGGTKLDREVFVELEKLVKEQVSRAGSLNGELGGVGDTSRGNAAAIRGGRRIWNQGGMS
jgi:hypothetical protein